MVEPQALTETPGGLSTQRFVLHAIYTKGSTLETALPPTMVKGSPNIDVEVQITATERPEKKHEVVVHLNLTGKQNGNLIWRIQLQQAGLYTFTDLSQPELRQALHGFCPHQIYPYACAQASILLAGAGFPPMMLSPINFELLYQQRLQEEAKKDGNKNDCRPLKIIAP